MTSRNATRANNATATIINFLNEPVQATDYWSSHNPNPEYNYGEPTVHYNHAEIEYQDASLTIFKNPNAHQSDWQMLGADQWD